MENAIRGLKELTENAIRGLKVYDPKIDTTTGLEKEIRKILMGRRFDMGQTSGGLDVETIHWNHKLLWDVYDKIRPDSSSFLNHISIYSWKGGMYVTIYNNSEVIVLESYHGWTTVEILIDVVNKINEL